MTNLAYFVFGALAMIGIEIAAIFLIIICAYALNMNKEDK